MILSAAGALLAACSRSAPGPAAPSPTQNEPQADYAAPPELSGASRGLGGEVTLAGTALPEARIRLAAPDGAAIGGTADAAGGWSLTVPAITAPRLVSLSEDAAGRLLRARGYVALLPAPGPPAVTIRPATGAEPFARSAAVSIAAVDYDRSGVAVVSGSAPPGQTVRVRLDGGAAGEGRANDRGVYVVSLSQPLPAGAHSIDVATDRGEASAAFQSAPAAPILKPPFTAARASGAWRIDWITPGGGVQTTVVFDPPGADG